MPGPRKTLDHERIAAPLQLRPAGTVMDLERLGSLHPYRLSFMRILLRHVMNERWKIRCETWDLDAEGYGTAIYTIDTPHSRFSFVVFAQHLDSARRSDRVIADQWDMTVTLCAGDVDDAQLQMLRANVPLQEAGRIDARSIVLSRANKSSRNFDYVVGELAAGRQPAPANVARVGYLYRTTAVYGSGKFGMADWQKVRSLYPDFALPFAAEMFTCYMIRQFSLAQADHIARARAPGTAVKMDDGIKRYFGIGNATGLGMAPFLINHPQLISRWIEVRETALARVIQFGSPTAENRGYLHCLLQKASLHLREIDTDNELQNSCNAAVIGELGDILGWISSRERFDWAELVEHAAQTLGPETQELINSFLMELYPELSDDLEGTLCIEESLELIPGQSLADAKALIETHYDWALAVDFSQTSKPGRVLVSVDGKVRAEAGSPWCRARRGKSDAAGHRLRRAAMLRPPVRLYRGGGLSVGRRVCDPFSRTAQHTAQGSVSGAIDLRRHPRQPARLRRASHSLVTLQVVVLRCQQVRPKIALVGTQHDVPGCAACG